MQWMTEEGRRRARQESRAFGVRRTLPLLRPLGWLARGWRDLCRCPGPSLAQGGLMALAGALILALAHQRFWLLAGAFSGFLLVAPVLATGFYALSAALERGRPADWRTLAQAWRPQGARGGRLVVFGLLLAFAGTGWVVCSAALITAFGPPALVTPLDFLRLVVLAETGPGARLFEAWLGLGALLAAPLFASTVVAIPLLLEREVSVLGAVLTSWRVVLAHPAPLALWAGLILALTLLGMAAAMLGLVLVLPLLGHASWHAYRDLLGNGA